MGVLMNVSWEGCGALAGERWAALARITLALTQEIWGRVQPREV